MRQAAIETMNTWLEQTGMTCFVEAELFTNALATESPFLRTDVCTDLYYLWGNIHMYAWVVFGAPGLYVVLIYQHCL